MTSQQNDYEKPSSKSKNYAISALLTVGICLLSFGIALICWNSVLGSIPQISRNNEEHFHAHVISPIPQSVEILDVKSDDLIIHPDVTYYFRFHIDRADLEKIISYRKLSAEEGTCSEGNYSYPPEWWDVENLNNVEKYIYEEGKYGDLLITLCYDVPNKTAYYMFLTY